MHLEILHYKTKDGIKYYGKLRTSYREDGTVKHKELGTIAGKSLEQLKTIQAALRGEHVYDLKDWKEIGNYEYGLVHSISGVIKELGLEEVIYSRKELWRQRVLAMIIGKIAYRGSKLGLANIWKRTALGEEVGLGKGNVNVNDFYRAMDELIKRKEKIERKLIRKHLKKGYGVLYDITSSYVEGSKNEYAAFGYNRDGKKGKKQIVIGLVCNEEGVPVASQVFKGSTSDQSTLEAIGKSLKELYGVEEMIFIGDRGLLTKSKVNYIRELGFNFIRALTHREMLEKLKNKKFYPSLFQEDELVEIEDAENQERYIVCKDLLLKHNETKTRQELLEKTERKLAQIAEQVNKGKLKDVVKIGARIGKWLYKWKVAKFIGWKLQDGKLYFWRKQEELQQAELLDGCYVIATDIKRNKLSKTKVIKMYKRLQRVEKDFRMLKTVGLEVRPINHRKADRVKSHVFICTLALYVLFHIEQRLKSLFENDKRGSQRKWSMKSVWESLKAIRKSEHVIEGHSFYTITVPDKEQQFILNLLNQKL